MAPTFSKPVTFFYSASSAKDCHVFLEELTAAYGGEPDYEFFRMSATPPKEGEGNPDAYMKSPWFLEISPNGTIPALLHDGFPVFESGAILFYLSQTFDKEKKFTFDPVQNPKEYSELQQWLLFSHGNLVPAMLLIHRLKSNMEMRPSPLALEDSTKDVMRILAVLDARLKGREYLVGPGTGKYTIADIKAAPWIMGIKKNVGLQNFPDLEAWVDRIANRPAVKAAKGY